MVYIQLHVCIEHVKPIDRQIYLNLNKDSLYQDCVILMEYLLIINDNYKI